MQLSNQIRPKKRLCGATLVEALVSIAIFGIAAISLLTGVSFGFSTIGSIREELRATQILIEKMETIRLYSWNQVNTPGFVPEKFTASYYPPNVGDTNGLGSGVTYSGTVSISAGPTGNTYSSDVRTVNVGLSWTTGGRVVSQEISTLVSRGGLQRYIY